MAAYKGHKKAGGRKKGSLNKTTTALKEMILQSLDKVGGVNYLQKQATNNPNAYLSLIGRVLPLTVAGDKENPLNLVIGTLKCKDEI